MSYLKSKIPLILIILGLLFYAVVETYFLFQGVFIRNTIRGMLFSIPSIIMITSGLLIYYIRLRYLKKNLAKTALFIAIFFNVAFILLSIMFLV